MLEVYNWKEETIGKELEGNIRWEGGGIQQESRKEQARGKEQVGRCWRKGLGGKNQERRSGKEGAGGKEQEGRS